MFVTSNRLDNLRWFKKSCVMMADNLKSWKDKDKVKIVGKINNK